MWKVLVLCVLAAVEARPPIATFHENTAIPFIVGGRPAGKGRWPWQLSLQIDEGLGYRHTCGSSLLGANKALTAAHCTEGRSGFRILAGASNIGASPDHEAESLVSSTTEHPGFDRFGPGVPNDVGTMTLATAVNAGGAIAYASLAPTGGPNYAGNECWISGWGRLHGDDGPIPDQLQEVRIDVLTLAECRNRMPINIQDNVLDQHICIHGNGQQGVCQGDSGGPLNCMDGNWLVVGVTSWAVASIDSSCMTEYPNVYARVTTFRSWIDSN